MGQLGSLFRCVIKCSVQEGAILFEQIEQEKRGNRGKSPRVDWEMGKVSDKQLQPWEYRAKLGQPMKRKDGTKQEILFKKMDQELGDKKVILVRNFE